MVPAPSTRRVGVRRLALAAAVCLAISGPAAATGIDAGNPVAATQVKAAFLFTFIKFVQWPAAEAPLVIGVAGDNELAVTLARAVAGRTVDGRAVEVRKLGSHADPDGYHVLHLGGLDDDAAAALLARVRGPVLTVGETVRFLRDGGMVRIFIDDQRLRFQVNRGRADQVGVKISAQALSLAAK